MHLYQEGRDVQTSTVPGTGSLAEHSSEFSITEMFRDWQAHRRWLSSHHCMSLNDFDFEREADALVGMERRIYAAQPCSSSEVAMQIEVYTNGGEDAVALTEVHAFIKKVTTATSKRWAA